MFSQTTMQSAALALAAANLVSGVALPQTSSTPAPSYKLESTSVGGPDGPHPGFTGLFVTTVHTGAGQSAAAIDSAPYAEVFQLNNTYLGDDFASTPFTVELSDNTASCPAEATQCAPVTYKAVTLQNGLNTPDFSFDASDGNKLENSGPSDLSAFTVCNVSAITLGIGENSYILQLLWRDASTPVVSDTNCEDVYLFGQTD